MPPSSPSESLPPPVSPPDVSSRRPPLLVCEHGGPFEVILVVDLYSDEEESFPDITQYEEFARRLFGELNRRLLGPPDDGNVIILGDSDEEEEVRKEVTTDADAASPSVVNSLALSVSIANVDDAPDGVQGDSSDGGDKASSP
jgi:hypothetical protein